MGWRGTRNGELLRRAEAAKSESLITTDCRLEFQQNIAHLGFGVIVLMVPTTSPEDVLALITSIDQAFGRITPGRVLHVGTDPRGSRSRRP